MQKSFDKIDYRTPTLDQYQSSLSETDYRNANPSISRALSKSLFQFYQYVKLFQICQMALPYCFTLFRVLLLLWLIWVEIMSTCLVWISLATQSNVCCVKPWKASNLHSIYYIHQIWFTIIIHVHLYIYQFPSSAYDLSWTTNVESGRVQSLPIPYPIVHNCFKFKVILLQFVNKVPPLNGNLSQFKQKIESHMNEWHRHKHY